MIEKYSKELTEKIIYLLNNYKQIKLRCNFVKEISPLIYKETSWLPKNSLFKERIYCIKINFLKY